MQPPPAHGVRNQNQNNFVEVFKNFLLTLNFFYLLILMIQTAAKAKLFPYQKEVDEVCENELLEGRKANWSVIPSARRV